MSGEGIVDGRVIYIAVRLLRLRFKKNKRVPKTIPQIKLLRPSNRIACAKVASDHAEGNNE